MQLVMPKIQAWERLNNPEYSSHLNTEQLYELILRAGYTEEVATKAANKRAHERLDAGMVL